MASLQLTGTVVKVYPTQQVSEKFKKRVLVVEDNSNEKYPEFAVFEFGNDKVNLLDELRSGETVTVDFNVRGRPYQKPGEDTKYFCSLSGWKLEVLSKAAGSNQGMVAISNVATVDESEDLPFN